MALWDQWVEAVLSKLASENLLRSTRPISLSPPPTIDGLETFDGLQHFDRSSVEVDMDEYAFNQWLSELPDLGGETIGMNENVSRKLLLFSGNDYLGLSFHPSLRKAAAKAAQEHGMGPRGSALVCGYTNYHQLLENSLAELKMKEDCLLCPTGFAANLAFMSALGSISSLLSINGKPSQDERIAIFSDALNHASIIDGIRLVERLQEAKVFVYKHGDMVHLNTLLSGCKIEKKVVITDTEQVWNFVSSTSHSSGKWGLRNLGGRHKYIGSCVLEGRVVFCEFSIHGYKCFGIWLLEDLFSMDGDFAPIADLVNLRKKHNFLLVVDDAHSTLVCGKNGGGILEEYGCESDVDICIGTLSKAVGCQGGFIACSNKWKRLLQSRGRSFIFSTSLPVPVVAACQAALFVARKEKWRRIAIWNRVCEFNVLTKMNITSPIISLVIGSEKAALSASRHMLQSGFHITAIRPPTVPPNSCRLRITLSATHSFEDVKRLVSALSRWFIFPVADDSAQIASKL